MEKEQMQARIADLVERTDRAEELAEGHTQPPKSEIHPHPEIQNTPTPPESRNWARNSTPYT